MAVLYMAKDLVGKDVHRIGNRTSCCTLLTLVTVIYCLTARINHFREERISPLSRLFTRIHLQAPTRKEPQTLDFRLQTVILLL